MLSVQGKDGKEWRNSLAGSVRERASTQRHAEALTLYI